MSFFLWTGVTPSCYKSSGNIPWSTQLLKTLTIKPAKTSLFILNTFVGMPSFWQALSNTQIVNYFSYCSIARFFFEIQYLMKNLLLYIDVDQIFLLLLITDCLFYLSQLRYYLSNLVFLNWKWFLEKKLLKAQNNSALSDIFLPSSIRFIFLAFWVLFSKKKDLSFSRKICYH